MSVTKYNVSLCERAEIRDFIEHWHYSKSVNGLRSSYCFKLEDGGELIGACMFGALSMANVWRKYGNAENEVVELNRLCCIDDTPKNTESYFIGACLRWLKNNTDIKTVVSYADPNFGHNGTIYRASNFKYIGTTSPGKVIDWNGKTYHDKAERARYKGELKPFAKRLRKAVANGEATYRPTEGKHIYVYQFNNRR